MSTPTPGRPEAAAVVWQPDTDADTTGQTRHRRVRGLVGALVGGAVATAFWWFGHPTAATVVGTIAGLNALGALVLPAAALARLSALVGVFVEGVGHVLGAVILGPAFYLVFTPLGLARRGRDPLQRRRAAPAWAPRPPPPSPADDAAPDERYRRTF